MKRKKTLGSDSINQQQIWPSGTRWRTPAARSSSIATHSSSSSSSTLYAYKTDFLIASTTPQSPSYTFLLVQKRMAQTNESENGTHTKKKPPSGSRTTDLDLAGTETYLLADSISCIRRPRLVCTYTYEYMLRIFCPKNENSTRRREHGRGLPQSRDRRARWGTTSKQHTEWWTSSRFSFDLWFSFRFVFFLRFSFISFNFLFFFYSVYQV